MLYRQPLQRTWTWSEAIIGFCGMTTRSLKTGKIAWPKNITLSFLRSTASATSLNTRTIKSQCDGERRQRWLPERVSLYVAASAVLKRKSCEVGRWISHTWKEVRRRLHWLSSGCVAPVPGSWTTVPKNGWRRNKNAWKHSKNQLDQDQRCHSLPTKQKTLWTLRKVMPRKRSFLPALPSLRREMFGQKRVCVEMSLNSMQPS